MSEKRPLFQLTGVEMAAQFLKEGGDSIGILTLAADDGDITFALDVHGARALNDAMNSFLEAAAEHAAKHKPFNPPRRRRDERSRRR